MKRYLILLLLLIPIALAQSSDNILEARKAQLDYKAADFILQMNTAISFSQNKNITASELSGIQTDFENKLKEALQASNIEDLKIKENELRNISKKFKDLAKDDFKDYISGLREAIKNARKDYKNEKLRKADELRKDALRLAFDKRINELNSSISEGKKEGKGTKVYELLLDKFNKEKKDINNTDFGDSQSISEDAALTSISKGKDFLSSVAEFFVTKMKQFDEGR